MPTVSTDGLFDPTWTVAKILFTGIAGYSMLSTFMLGFKSITETLVAGTNNMIFDAEFANIILWVGLIVGIILIEFVSYWFNFEDANKGKAKNGEEVEKFDKKYLVAGALTIIASILFAGVALFYGTKYIMTSTTIVEPGLIFVIAFVFGAVGAYLMDAFIFHPIADGRAAQVYIKGQEILRAEAEKLAKSETIFQTVKDICVQKGLANSEDIDAVYKVFADSDSLDVKAISDLVEYKLFKKTQGA